MSRHEPSNDHEPDRGLLAGTGPAATARSGRFGRRGLAAAVVALGLVAAACGSDSDSSTDTGASSDDAAADEAMADDEAMEDDAMEDDAMEDDAMEDDAMEDDDAMADDDAMEDEDAMEDDAMEDDDAMADEDAMEDEDAMAEDMNDLMSQIADRSDLSIFDEAIHGADLQDMLHEGGPFTIFAPTDDAFEDYLGAMGMTAEDAMGDMEALAALLEAHIVDGEDDSAMVMGLDGQTLTTLAGTELTITVDGETVMVGEATVVDYDVTADNGVVHVIDAVLSPPAS